MPRLSVDPQAPYNSLLAEQLQFSEFTDWSEVARWGSVLFASAPGGELLAQQIAAIRSHAGTREAQLLAALDFVQKEVRYFGTEIGASTHRPASPEQVLRQRFGDCKDKVALLLALLDGLDIKATPVLVSLALRSAAAELLPSPLDFDHVIARVELDGLRIGQRTSFLVNKKRRDETSARHPYPPVQKFADAERKRRG